MKCIQKAEKALEMRRTLRNNTESMTFLNIFETTINSIHTRTYIHTSFTAYHTLHSTVILSCSNHSACACVCVIIAFILLWFYSYETYICFFSFYYFYCLVWCFCCLVLDSLSPLSIIFDFCLFIYSSVGFGFLFAWVGRHSTKWKRFVNTIRIKME